MPIIGSFGAGSKGGYGRGGAAPVDVHYLVVAGGGGNATSYSAGGAGGYRTSFPGGTKISLVGSVPITIGAGGLNAVFRPASPSFRPASSGGDSEITGFITS